MKIKSALLSGIVILGFGFGAATVTEVVTPIQEVKADVGQKIDNPNGSEIQVIYGNYVATYDSNGVQSTTRMVAPDSTWATYSGYRYNGETYYKIADDTYLRASDVKVIVSSLN